MIDQRKGSLTGYCLVLVTLAAGVIQTGCAEPARRQSKARQTATSQTAAGTANSDQKAEQLRQTFEKDRSAGNQIRLAEAQTEAADAHVTMARQCRADHRPRDARKELTAALSQMPGHPQAITMAREVDQDIAKADAFVRQAVAARDKKDDATALHCADQVLAIDRTDATARQIVDTARGAAFKSTLQQASEASTSVSGTQQRPRPARPCRSIPPTPRPRTSRRKPPTENTPWNWPKRVGPRPQRGTI